MKIADIIVPRGGENVVAIDLIVRQIKNQLTERGLSWDHVGLGGRVTTQFLGTQFLADPVPRHPVGKQGLMIDVQPTNASNDRLRQNFEKP